MNNFKVADLTHIKDKNDRDIGILALTPAEQFRLMKVIGKAQGNDTYIGMAMMAASARQIDGAPYAGIDSERDFDQIFDKLGTDGWNAVQEYYAKLGAETENAAEEVMDTAKN